MDCRSYNKKIISSALTFVSIGISVVTSFGQNNQASKKQAKPCNLTRQVGSISEGAIGLDADGDYPINATAREKPKIYLFGTKPLQIKSKPIARFTDEAKQNCVEGTVILKITFFANGTVGKFKVIKRLDYGLSEEAISVARRIKFEPATKNNKAITVTKKIRYNFTIY